MPLRVSTGDRDAVLRQIRWCTAVQTLCTVSNDPTLVPFKSVPFDFMVSWANTSLRPDRLTVGSSVFVRVSNTHAQTTLLHQTSVAGPEPLGASFIYTLLSKNAVNREFLRFSKSMKCCQVLAPKRM